VNILMEGHPTLMKIRVEDRRDVFRVCEHARQKMRKHSIASFSISFLMGIFASQFVGRLQLMESYSWPIFDNSQTDDSVRRFKKNSVRCMCRCEVQRCSRMTKERECFVGAKLSPTINQRRTEPKNLVLCAS
jgi:hypothetical protein